MILSRSTVGVVRYAALEQDFAGRLHRGAMGSASITSPAMFGFAGPERCRFAWPVYAFYRFPKELCARCVRMIVSDGEYPSYLLD